MYHSDHAAKSVLFPYVVCERQIGFSVIITVIISFIITAYANLACTTG